MLKVLLIFFIFSSCARENKKFIIEELRETCSECVTAFEEQQSENCIEDSTDLYNDLLLSTNQSFTNLTIGSKWEVTYNESSDKGEVYLIDKKTEDGEQFLYFYINTGNGATLGDIDNPLNESLVIRVSKTSNSALKSRLQALSCIISDNGTDIISNSDNESELNYVLTTKKKVKQATGTSIEEVYNFRVYQNQPLFMLIFGFEYNQITYSVDDVATTPTANKFILVKVDNVDVSTVLHDELKDQINLANKCHLDSFIAGDNIPFNFQPSTCGSSSYYDLPTFPKI